MTADDVKIVVAIDVGSTYSGYAYSFAADPSYVTCSCFGGYPKTPTSVLVDKGRKLVCFGDEAEEKYHKLCQNNGQHPFVLYRNFKSTSFDNETLDKRTKVRDVSTMNSMSLFDLYVMTLHYLKNHAIRIINRHAATYSEDDVMFVVLVPTVADDRSKWFVRQAAMKAGVRSERLILALESEAASIWYQTLEDHVTIQAVGTRYMMVDIGGGVADISVHESAGDGHVGSLSPPSGGKWGGATVDNCFVSFIQLIFGTDELKAFIYEYPSEWLKFFRKYEAAIQTANPNTGISVDVPMALLDFARQSKGVDIISSPTLKGHFTLDGTKLLIDGQTTADLFQYTLNSLCNEIDRLANIGIMTDENVNHVTIVGGLAGNKVVQDRLKERIKNYNLGFPNSGNTFAMKGAVRLGHDKSLVNSRIVPLTYALHNTVPFDTKQHKDASTEEINGVKMCTENFHPLVKIGTKVKSGTELHETDMPLRATDKEHVVKVVSCGLVPELPSLVTHHCVHRESTFTIPLPFGCQVEDKVFDRATVVGETELYFKITFKKGNMASYMRYLEYE